jgi:SAM-dependent methyltransferase
MSSMLNVFYDLTYRYSTPAWDDGKIPSAVVDLAKYAHKDSRALDLGCGTGTHAVYLAEQGLHVVGVDGAATAIQHAQARAQAHRVYPEFFVHDVTRLGFLQPVFDLALDVGCFHGLNGSERKAYARELIRLTRPGSIFLVWGFARHFPGIGLDAVQVEQHFSPEFTLTRIDPANLHNQSSSWYWLRRQ